MAFDNDKYLLSILEERVFLSEHLEKVLVKCKTDAVASPSIKFHISTRDLKHYIFCSASYIIG